MTTERKEIDAYLSIMLFFKSLIGYRISTDMVLQWNLDLMNLSITSVYITNNILQPGLLKSVEKNLDIVESRFDKRQGTREIGSLYRGSLQYTLKGRTGGYIEEFDSLYRDSFNRSSTV